jgi:hypothetical protein
MFLHRKPNSTLRGSLTVFLVIAVSVRLAGCQGTIHDRWARESDSVDTWTPKFENIPIDVHGAVPGTDAQQTLERIPNGTDDAKYAKAGNAGTLLAAQRIVLYVGGNTLPINSTYCNATPTMRTVRIPADKVMMGVAFCDGPRLVVTARREFALSAVMDKSMSHTIAELKYRLIFALSMSPSQIPKTGTGYS